MIRGETHRGLDVGRGITRFGKICPCVDCRMGGQCGGEEWIRGCEEDEVNERGHPSRVLAEALR